MDVTLVNGMSIIFLYEQFQVASVEDKYELTVGGFHGTTTDLLHGYSGNTLLLQIDHRDNDSHVSDNCALWSIETGGWWYASCGSMWPIIAILDLDLEFT